MRVRCIHPVHGERVLNRPVHELTIGRNTTGNQVDVDLSPDRTISRSHVRISRDTDGNIWIEDLSSALGTMVNGTLLNSRKRVLPNTRIQIGEWKIVVEVVSSKGKKTMMLDATRLPFDSSLDTTDTNDTVTMIRHQLRAFCAFSQALVSITDENAAFTTLLQQIQQAIPAAEHIAVLALGEQDSLLLKASWPPGRPLIDISLIRSACSNGEAFLWNPPLGPAEVTPTSNLVIQQAIYAPLVWQGQVLGVIYTGNQHNRNAFTATDLELVNAMASQTALFVRHLAMRQELRREEATRNNLLRQFPPQVAARLLQSGGRLQRGGQRVNPVTVLLSDVRGFTTLSAGLEPDEVVLMINEMFDRLTPIIFEYEGTVDKYIGDAVMAVFGSPEPDSIQWEHAIRAALAMQEAMRDLHRSWKRRGLPEAPIGIGIHSGDVVHGFIGSEERIEFTVIGDTVNRASRFCDGAGPGEVLISRAVYERVFELVHVEPREIRSKHPEHEPNLAAYVVTKLVT